MNDKELEKIIKDTLRTSAEPGRDSLMRALSKIESAPVTKNPFMRYNIWAVTPNIINNKFADIVSILQSKRLVLIPSLIVLFFVSAFSLSPRASYDPIILELAEQSAVIEEESMDYGDQAVLTSFDEPDINDIVTPTDEI